MTDGYAIVRFFSATKACNQPRARRCFRHVWTCPLQSDAGNNTLKYRADSFTAIGRDALEPRSTQACSGLDKSEAGKVIGILVRLGTAAEMP
jgi:hypothetical protein